MATESTEPSSVALARARQIFRFLKAFTERSLPVQRRLADQPWSFRLAELPSHPSVSLGEVHLVRPGEAQTPGEATADGTPLLRVRRPQITRAVAPPAPLLEWIQPGWEDPNGRIEAVREHNVHRGSETVTVAFSDDPARIQALAEWRGRWERWAEAERPARAAMRIFERLYELRGRIELESERVELMLGDGRLRWRTLGGDVDHPVLLQRVELEFDADVPEFRLLDADRDPEIYGAILHDGQGISPETFTLLRAELEKGGFHPLAREATSAYLRRLVQLLSPRGAFNEDAGALSAGADPIISRDPALFLRVRVTGFPAAFERVLEDLETGNHLPSSITRLVGLTPPPENGKSPTPRSPWGEPLDVLLSKPANAEQIEIARALERHRAVLVQGPPGTGKSHTIANLIGHLVANDKRVLVTSHTTKALRVLRGHLVETLQPLCVAVLENDLDARTQMEQSVRGILTRLTTAHEETLENEVASFARTRASLNTEIDELTDNLRLAREAEYRQILLAGEAIAPSDAARWVRDHADGNEWIAGPVEAGAPLPLSQEELSELYGLNAKITTIEGGEIDEGLPDLDKIPDRPTFQRLIEALNHNETPGMGRFWSRTPSSADRNGLEHLFDLVSQAAQDLAAFTAWQRRVVAAGHAGGAERDLWIALRDQVSQATTRWERSRPVLLDHACQVQTQLSHEETLKHLDEIVVHLGGGGSLGVFALLFHGKWKGIIQGARVNGRTPAEIDHFKALVTYITLEEGRRRLRARWSRQAEPAGLPAFRTFGNPPERSLHDYATQFDSLLEWWPARWAEIASAMAEGGFQWEEFRGKEVANAAPAQPFERDASLLAGPLQNLIKARRDVVYREVAREALLRLEQAVEPHRGPMSMALLQAIRARKLDDYDRARNALLDLAAKQALWRRRRELLHKLAAAAPTWANQVENREGRHAGPQVPGDARVGWRWRQLRQEIDRRAELDEIRLTERLHQRRAEIREITATLIDRRAWLNQLRRTDLPARQALQGWADTQKKIGRGTGKRVPELQAKARELLARARDAVPVWIMPLNRVADSFDPRHRRFDVVIVDEASQSDVTGLLCWYLGERVAVVGDHEQVSPLAVGQDIALMQALINEHLGGIPNNHLYDGTTSIYHLARQCFGGTIALREHFRCVPDIIEFSNRLSYNGEIRPLRNPGSTPRPHVIEYVADGRSGTERSQKSNLAEARIVAALVKAACESPEYKGKTMGAVTLLGDEQARLIQDVTVGLCGAIELDHRRFVAGNAAQFQGDERHVMFLSMVDTPTGGRLPLRRVDLFKQRYNVAASRAQDQVWLVHSLDPDRDLQTGDLRRALIEHVRDPSAVRRAAEAAERRAESPFEKAVIERLVNGGYRVNPQVWVGRYRIDMVVGEGSQEVALECDGDRFHGIDQIPADMARQAVLERAGWRFVRVRGTRFFRDPEGTTAWIVEELQRLGVQPVGQIPAEQAPDAVALAFRERVVRRAHEVMRERGWLGSPQFPASETATT